jgi:hypothetical protein
MSLTGTGSHASSDAASFMGLTQPVHLPILSTSDPTASTYLPAPQVTKAAEVHGYTDIPPERQGVDFGGTDYFKYILNDNDVLTGVTLCVRLDALTAGGGGVNPRYPDDVLAHAIDRITFTYGKDLQVIEGDTIHWDFMQEETPEEFARQAPLRGCNLSVGRRIANATAARWYYLRIPFFWAKRDSDAWHQYALQRLTRVVIQWRRPQAILQQEVAATVPTATAGGTYILDHFLRFHIAAVTNGVKQEFVSRIKAQGSAGWLYLIGQEERLTQTLTTGTTASVIQLNTFTKFGYNLRFQIRRAASLVENTLDNDRWVIVPITAATLDISGKRYLQPTDDTWLTYEVDDRLFKGPPELAIYNIPFCENPDLHSAALGGIDFSNATNPQLTLTHVALPGNCVIDFYLKVHNYVRLTMYGNQTGAELVQPL